MNFQKKMHYYFIPNSNNQEQSLFIILFMTFWSSAYLLYANIQKDLFELIFLKTIFVLLNAFFLLLIVNKKDLVTSISRTFIIVLFLVITFEIALTLSTIEVFIMLIFFPICTLILCRKKVAVIVISSFIFLNMIVYSLGFTHVHFNFFDAMNILIGMTLFIGLVDFYITSFKYHEKTLEAKNNQIKLQHDLLANIFDKAPLIYSSFNAQGKLTYISDYELSLMGKSLKDIKAKHFRAVYKYHPEIINQFESLRDKHEQKFVYSLYGRHFDFRLTQQRDSEENFIGYSLIAMDISEEVKFKDALQKSEELLEVVTNTAFEAIIISQGATIITANQKALEMFGYDSMDTINNQNVQQFITNDSLFSIYRNSLKNDENPHFIRGLKADGSSFPMELKSKTISYLDQTFRVTVIQSFDSLSRAKNEISKLAQVVEQNSSIIMITDAEGALEYVNQSFVDKMGYSREEALQRKPHIVASGHQNSDFYDDLWSTITKGEVWVKEMINRTKDGDIITVKNTISSIKNDNGQITHYIAMQEDITHLKKQEQMILAKTKQAQMGEMLSMIAHQWRQPLSAISVIGAKVRLGLELGTLNDKSIKENLSLVDLQVQYLSDTIDDFRNFFKPNKELTTIKVQSLIQKTTEIISKQLELHDITLTVDTGVDVTLKTYSHEIIQVLLSLIQNSKDQLQSKLLVTKEITLSVAKKDGLCIITLKDTAGGIPTEIINDIFLPYFSTKNVKQGTGLGLHMCKTIVEDHCHGSITVENWEEGVIFFISLPL